VCSCPVQGSDYDKATCDAQRSLGCSADQQRWVLLCSQCAVGVEPFCPCECPMYKPCMHTCSTALWIMLTGSCSRLMMSCAVLCSCQSRWRCKQTTGLALLCCRQLLLGITSPHLHDDWCWQVHAVIFVVLFAVLCSWHVHCQAHWLYKQTTGPDFVMFAGG
jgi:hypothetical protein